MSRSRIITSRAVKAQRARQMAGQPTAGFFGDLIGGIGSIATSIIPGTWDDKLFDAGRSLFGSNQKPGARADCPPGFRVDPNTGRCLQEGISGTVARILPGGSTGALPQVPQGYGGAVVGSFGVPALQPAQASAMSLRCPPGAVLGKDNLCYQKGSIPAQFRKWRPARKPPISAKDWRALQTSARVAAKAKKIAGTAGFSCKKR